jgi:TM2 domain-containing membrane protein YozV
MIGSPHELILDVYDYAKGTGSMFCSTCGKEIPAGAVVCIGCGRAAPGAAHSIHPEELESVQGFAGKKIAAGICGILLGALGIHKFILGLTTPGVIMLLVTLLTFWLTCGAGPVAMWIIGLIEGVLYLTKSDEEFYETYAVQKRGWF